MHMIFFTSKYITINIVFSLKTEYYPTKMDFAGKIGFAVKIGSLLFCCYLVDLCLSIHAILLRRNTINTSYG